MKIVFTNGCFDLLHAGHIELLKKARALGDYLIVAINSDESIRRIKREPIIPQEQRAEMLGALECVDEVIVFDELTPERWIHATKPDILVKGGDWHEDDVLGGDFVKANGGRVVIIPRPPASPSTTAIIEKILLLNGSRAPCSRAASQRGPTPAPLPSRAASQRGEVPA